MQFIEDRKVDLVKSTHVTTGNDGIPRALWAQDNQTYPCTVIDHCDIEDMGMLEVYKHLLSNDLKFVFQQSHQGFNPKHSVCNVSQHPDSSVILCMSTHTHISHLF